MMMITPGEIDGVRLVPAKKSADKRGQFLKLCDPNEPPNQNYTPNFQAISISENYLAGTLRGIHFQAPPHAEAKIISCISGSVFDVFVDLRPGSKTLGSWASIELSDNCGFSLYLPEGIAHGYQTLCSNTSLLYGISTGFASEFSHSLDYSDNNLSIQWPLPEVNVSEKDRNGLSLSRALQIFQDGQ